MGVGRILADAGLKPHLTRGFKGLPKKDIFHHKLFEHHSFLNRGLRFSVVERKIREYGYALQRAHRFGPSGQMKVDSASGADLSVRMFFHRTTGRQELRTFTRRLLFSPNKRPPQGGAVAKGANGRTAWFTLSA